MGEMFLRQQAHGFRHRHAAHLDKLKIPNLISNAKPDLMSREIRCEASDGGPEIGAPVVLLQQPDGSVAVLSGNRVVGQVDVGEIDDLAPALEIGGGVLRAEVTHCSAVSLSFIVRLASKP